MQHEITLSASKLWNIVVASKAQRIEEYGNDGYSEPILCLYEIQFAGIHVVFNLKSEPTTAHVIVDQIDTLIRGARQTNNESARRVFRTIVARNEHINHHK